MINQLKRLWTEEEGQGMVEYGLIIALVAIVAIVGLRAIGGTLGETFDEITDGLLNAGGGEGGGE